MDAGEALFMEELGPYIPYWQGRPGRDRTPGIKGRSWIGPTSAF